MIDTENLIKARERFLNNTVIRENDPEDVGFLLLQAIDMCISSLSKNENDGYCDIEFHDFADKLNLCLDINWGNNKHQHYKNDDTALAHKIWREAWKQGKTK